MTHVRGWRQYHCFFPFAPVHCIASDSVQDKKVTLVEAHAISCEGTERGNVNKKGQLKWGSNTLLSPGTAGF